MQNYDQLGKVFHEFRRNRNISLKQVADDTVSVSQISRFERGESDITLTRFLRMLEKKDQLDFSGNIRSWLYSAASRVIKEHRLRIRRETELCCGDLDVDTVSAEDRSGSGDDAAALLSALTDEEYRLLEEYYDSEHGSKSAVAKKYGITLPQLYKRVQTLRLRLLRRQSDKDKN